MVRCYLDGQLLSFLMFCKEQWRLSPRPPPTISSAPGAALLPPCADVANFFFSRLETGRCGARTFRRCNSLQLRGAASVATERSPYMRRVEELEGQGGP